jgi:hypothetical protein
MPTRRSLLPFSLTVHPIVESITTELNVWYLDDATIADVPDIVFENLKRIINTAKEVGVHINPQINVNFFFVLILLMKMS